MWVPGTSYVLAAKCALALAALGLESARLLHCLLTGQYLAEWRSEHAHVRPSARTWECSLLDFATALLESAPHLDRRVARWYTDLRQDESVQPF
jgi:hypothetical protein